MTHGAVWLSSPLPALAVYFAACGSPVVERGTDVGVDVLELFEQGGSRQARPAWRPQGFGVASRPSLVGTATGTR